MKVVPVTIFRVMRPLMLVIGFCLLINGSQAQDPTPVPTPGTPQSNATAKDTQQIDFVREIQPILRESCFECHAGTTEEGDLNLGIKSKVFPGGDSSGVIVPGNSTDSLLMQLVSGDDEDRMMPPEGHSPLTKQQIRLLRRWIDQGAEWPEHADVLDPKMDRAKTHWAFQRLHQVEVPAAQFQDNWTKGPIDRFVFEQFKTAKLQPAQPADAKTLVRRLYFDLTGLPPTPLQVNNFEHSFSENSDAAIGELVDRLLASPRYGERWGRHWLDVARYADSDGQESDQDRPYAYHYRDFVIEALNNNMPYNQFVKWQIAGDEYEPQNDAAISATGFLTAGPAFKLPDSFLESERLRNRYNELDDVIATLGSGMLGLTVACARCHDHKYDAFSSKEYYQLLGVFHSGDRVSTKLPSGKEAFIFQDFDSQRRTTWLFRRSDFYDREIEVDIGFPAMLSSGPEAAEFWENAKQAYRDLGDPPSTLQRRALAEWMTDTNHGAGALLARVFVNRIWHHHFGKGLVTTTSDFGVRGKAPTHPILLEYLTHKFVESGWNIKLLHKEILTSAVWQQSSQKEATDPNGYQVDPANSLLWKMSPQRLEIEAVRDAMLANSETLNLQAGGPGFKPYIAPEANLARNLQGEAYPKQAKDDASTRRRSVYMFHKRLIPYPMFQAFDRPDLMTSCARRQNTTVAPQAMVILNDRFVRSVARDYAKLLLGKQNAESPSDQHAWEAVVELAFETSFSRSPTEAELKASTEFIQAQAKVRTAREEQNPRTEALADYCQSLFGLNEYLYID